MSAQLQPVTDPAILSGLNEGEAQPDSGTPQAVTDPDLLSKLNSDVTPGAGAAQPKDDASEAPFMDRVHVAQADNFDEKLLYFQHKYGKDAVKQEFGSDGTPQLTVKMPDGKQFRVTNAGFWATLAGDSPKFVGAGGGAMIGAEVGAAVSGPLAPVGAGLGAAIGGGIGWAAGKLGTESTKAVEGNYKKTPGELARTELESFDEGAEGEMGGAIIGKGVSKLLAGRLPAFITGATDESRQLTKDAWAKGGRPPYASMAPDAKKLNRIEVIAQGTVGDNHAQIERNTTYVMAELRDALKRTGVPEPFISDVVKNAMDENAAAVSHEALGRDIQESVRAHVNSVEQSIKKSGEAADAHIAAQMETVNKILDRPGALTGDEAANIITSARGDLKRAAEQRYDRVSSMIGDAKVVPVDRLSEIAGRIIKEMQPMRVAGIVKQVAEMSGKEVSPQDAVLFHEFGIDPGSKKLSLAQAQRLRTTLREKGKLNVNDPNRSTLQGDYATMAGAVDDAIDEAASDPSVRPAVRALRETQAWYRENIRKFKDAGIKQLAKQAESGMPMDPGKIVDIIAEPGRSARTATLRRVMGDEAWKQVQKTHLQKMLEPISDRDEMGRKVIDGVKLLDKLDPEGSGYDTLREVHGEESVKEMREIAQMLASRQGKIDPEQLQNLGVKDALKAMKARKAQLDSFLNENALGILRDTRKTGEEAYQYLTRAGAATEGRLIEAQKLFGENSPQMAGLRQAALEELARNANINTVRTGGNNAIEKALNQFTDAQKRILFPGDEMGIMRDFSKVIKFMFPHANEQGAAAFQVGAELQKKFWHRQYTNVVNSVMRFVVLHPSFAKWIVTGRDEGEPWIMRTASLFKKMSTPAVGEAASPAGQQAQVEGEP